MEKRLNILLRYFRHLRTAGSSLPQDAPVFLKKLEAEALCGNGKHFYAFDELEALRSQLRKNHRKITVTDFGAGSHLHNSGQRRISDIARSAVSPSKQSRLLFRLVDYLQPRTMLEFGTSLGLTAAYQAKAHSQSRFISLEGCPNISQVARDNFKTLGIRNLEVLTGEFDQTLPKALDLLKPLDYVFFDGNHQETPTLAYFEACLAQAHGKSVFIFDDIHWSKGMENAWKRIQRHPEVSLTVDLFFMGLVFFEKEGKGNFTLRV